MRWFRCRRPADSPTPPDPGVSIELAVPSRLERALVTLAVHTQQIGDQVARLERRMEDVEDTAAAALDLDRLEHLEQRVADATLHLPTHDDVLSVRLHSARLAAELARVTAELHAEIDRVGHESAGAAHAAAEAAVRAAVPTPTEHEQRVHTLAETIVDLSDSVDTLPADLRDSDRSSRWARTA